MDTPELLAEIKLKYGNYQALSDDDEAADLLTAHFMRVLGERYGSYWSCGPTSRCRWLSDICVDLDDKRYTSRPEYDCGSLEYYGDTLLEALWRTVQAMEAVRLCKDCGAKCNYDPVRCDRCAELYDIQKGAE